MRLVIIAAGSFIAHHVCSKAREMGLEPLCLSHKESPEGRLAAGDLVINFGLPSHYKTHPCSPEEDPDLAVATLAHRVGAKVCLLSSRRVYGPEVRWGALETADAFGDETVYGQNKAATERRVRLATEDAALILRLSNVFGFEYHPSRPRNTFVGSILASLKNQDRIVFNMHPDSRRDFIAAPDCAQAILTAGLSGRSGTYNLGRGEALRCGQIANWIINGYGRGELAVTDETVRDEFELDMQKFKRDFPLTTQCDLRDYCNHLGRMLRDA